MGFAPRVSWKATNHEERMPRALGRMCARFANTIPIHRASTALRNIDGWGRTGRNVGSTIFSSAREDPYREDLPILIAGCGTSQAPKYALRWPAAQVTGIDFSAT